MAVKVSKRWTLSVRQKPQPFENNEKTLQAHIWKQSELGSGLDARVAKRRTRCSRSVNRYLLHCLHYPYRVSQIKGNHFSSQWTKKGKTFSQWPNTSAVIGLSPQITAGVPVIETLQNSTSYMIYFNILSAVIKQFILLLISLNVNDSIQDPTIMCCAR